MILGCPSGGREGANLKGFSRGFTRFGSPSALQNWVFARWTLALEIQEPLLREKAALGRFTSKVPPSLTPLLCILTD
jgi:hypothetical protein